ncbi:MAG TPA: MarR family transcriptional regulator, partial [Thermopetrobacter sp.]|nr:MarR family transcriptional regulator [Thermopetrobacter sp.]
MTWNEMQALSLWRDVNLAMVHDDAPDLSARQMAILLIVYLEPPPHTV